MGWSGGTDLMEELIASFEQSLGDAGIPQEKIIAFWESAISAFEGEDWDGQDEIFGIDPLWDKAYSDSHKNQ